MMSRSSIGTIQIVLLWCSDSLMIHCQTIMDATECVPIPFCSKQILFFPKHDTTDAIGRVLIIPAKNLPGVLERGRDDVHTLFEEGENRPKEELITKNPNHPARNY